MAERPTDYPDAEGALLLEALAQRRTVCFIAHGGSMRPFLRDGDEVTVSGELTALKVGEVVLLRLGTFGALHRVVAIRPEGVVIKGDGMPQADGVFPRSQVVGRLVSLRRAGQNISPGGRGAVLYSVLAGHARRLLWPRLRRLLSSLSFPPETRPPT